MRERQEWIRAAEASRIKELRARQKKERVEEIARQAAAREAGLNRPRPSFTPEHGQAIRQARYLVDMRLRIGPGSTPDEAIVIDDYGSTGDSGEEDVRKGNCGTDSDKSPSTDDNGGSVPTPGHSKHSKPLPESRHNRSANPYDQPILPSSSNQVPCEDDCSLFKCVITTVPNYKAGVNAFKKDHPELVSGNLTCATVNVPDYRTVREDCGQQRRQHWNRSLADCGKIIAILTSTVTSAWTITLPLPPHCGLITSK
ncbi:unnamed protein product [Tilletia controversa]|nr:hypothetical protein CF328_g8100 [Tilletia controversa]CAD6978098.1 unnamed protein product [Tilletia controversa]